MIIEFAKVEEGLFQATNCVSGHDISVQVDMLGDYVAIVERQLEDGTFEAYEEVFGNLERAMEWCECPTTVNGKQLGIDNPVCLLTSFGA